MVAQSAQCMQVFRDKIKFQVILHHFILLDGYDQSSHSETKIFGEGVEGRRADLVVQCG